MPDKVLRKHLVFSRVPGSPKEYVQDRLRVIEDEIAELIADPATHLYVCGLRGMEEGVEKALANIAESTGQEWIALRDADARRGALSRRDLLGSDVPMGALGDIDPEALAATRATAVEVDAFVAALGASGARSARGRRHVAPGALRTLGRLAALPGTDSRAERATSRSRSFSGSHGRSAARSSRCSAAAHRLPNMLTTW